MPKKPKLKKIAVVVPKYGLVGGGERFVLELTERLAQNPRYDIHVFANKWLADSNRVTFHKVPIISFPKWLTTISFAMFAKYKIGLIGGFDLVHTHERIFKADICSMHFIPHRLWVKDIRRKKFLSLFDYATCWVEKQLFNNNQCFFMPVSSLAQQKMSDVYPLRFEQIEVIHPGIDIQRYGVKNQGTRRKSRAKFGCNESDFIILFVSMNFELKGLNRIISATEKIKATSIREKVKILVIGKGDEEKFTSLAHNANLDSQIIFAGVRQDMAKIYQASDILVLLSEFDTFGMVVTEAMASSLPVIISDKVGAADLVKNGESGFIVDRDDTETISKYIAKLVHLSNQRILMGEKAREITCQYTWDNVAKQVSTVYENVLKYKATDII